MKTENQTQLQCGACPGCEGVCRLKAEQPPALGGELEVIGYAHTSQDGYRVVTDKDHPPVIPGSEWLAPVELVDRAHVTQLQAALEAACNVAHARTVERDQLQAELASAYADKDTMRRMNNELNDTVYRLQGEVERQSSERQTCVESTQRACKVIGQLRGLLREVRTFYKRMPVGMAGRIDAALAGGKGHE